MTDDTTRNTNEHNFRNLPKDKLKAISSKGGKKKGLKGLAYIKKHDPKKFWEIIEKNQEARRNKNTVS